MMSAPVQLKKGRDRGLVFSGKMGSMGSMPGRGLLLLMKVREVR